MALDVRLPEVLEGAEVKVSFGTDWVLGHIEKVMEDGGVQIKLDYGPVWVYLPAASVRRAFSA